MKSSSTSGFPYFSILLFLWRKTLISMQEIQISMQEDRGRQGKTKTRLIFPHYILLLPSIPDAPMPPTPRLTPGHHHLFGFAWQMPRGGDAKGGKIPHIRDIVVFLVCNNVTRRPCWWSIQKKFFC